VSASDSALVAGTLFPEFALTASDGRIVTSDDLEGRRLVVFLCAGPAHEPSAALIVQAAAKVYAEDNAVLVPIARVPHEAWRRFVGRDGLDGAAPLSVGEDTATPFVVEADGTLWPTLLVVDEAFAIVHAQRATAPDGSGLDVDAAIAALR